MSRDGFPGSVHSVNSSAYWPSQIAATVGPPSASMIAGTVLLCPTTSTTRPPCLHRRRHGSARARAVSSDVGTTTGVRWRLDGQRRGRLTRAPPLGRDNRVHAAPRRARRPARPPGCGRASLSATSPLGASAFSPWRTTTTTCDSSRAPAVDARQRGQRQRGNDRTHPARHDAPSQNACPIEKYHRPSWFWASLLSG